MMSEWIPCSERLPKKNTDVLLYIPKRKGCKQNGIHIGKLKPIEADPEGKDNFWGAPTPGSDWTVWAWSYFEEPIPSHWMPLPKKPKHEPV